MVDKIELPNLENDKLLKFLIDEGVDSVEAPELEQLEQSSNSLTFMSGDKARMFVTRNRVADVQSISVFSAEQISLCIKILGKGSKVKFTNDKEFPVFVCDEDNQNVIALSPMQKELD